MRRLLSFLPLLLVVLAGCDSSDPGECGGAPCPEAPREFVYIGNQGIFSDNSGTITRYEPVSGETTALAPADSLGGLVQGVLGATSLTSIPGLYTLLNYDDSFSTGRGQVAQLDPENGALVGTIDVSTPRAMVVTSPARAFVSNLYSATVTPIDLLDFTSGAPISVGANPEGLAVAGGRLYVANSGFGFGTTLSVIDPGALAVVDSVESLCFGPRTLLTDADDEVWVFCTGYSDFPSGEIVEDGAVVVLDGATGEEQARIEVEGLLGAASLGQDAFYSADRQEVFAILGQEILRFDTRTNTLAARVTVDGPPISAVGYDDGRDQLYLGRLDAANAFSAAGFVTIHDRDGAEVGRFDAGVVPGSITFLSIGGEG